MRAADHIQAILPEITAIRRDIHAHSRDTFQEVRTAQLVADLLRSWDMWT